MNILLVEPDFPIPAKSKNHANFLPIGLLKIGSYHRAKSNRVRLVRGNLNRALIGIKPDRILVTSLFTYWSQNVKATVQHYRKMFPRVPVEVGGIFATLMPEACKSITGCDKVSAGLYAKGQADEVKVDYSLLPAPVEYQIIHASRGCFRHCGFCGTWKIEPTVSYKRSILGEIETNMLIFYDNNLLANPNIENILEELSCARRNGRKVYSECQSGLDGRILLRNPNLSQFLKKANFLNPRIAWDTTVSDHRSIKEQISILHSAGYFSDKRTADIYIFMLFNHKQSYDELCEKMEFCRKWGVLIIDCRFRPLDLLEDNYNPRAKHQEDGEYYIHKGWSDEQVRDFRRKVRRQNIAIRLDLPGRKYISGVENHYVPT